MSDEVLSSSRHTLYSFNFHLDEDYEVPKRSLSQNQLIFGGPLRSGIQGPMIMNPIFMEDQPTYSSTPLTDSISVTSIHPEDQEIVLDEEDEQEKEEVGEGEGPGLESTSTQDDNHHTPRYVSIFTVSNNLNYSGSNANPPVLTTPTTSSGHSSASLSSSSPIVPQIQERRATRGSASRKLRRKPRVERSPTTHRRSIVARKCVPRSKDQSSQTSESYTSSGRGSTSMTPVSSDTSDSDKRRAVSFIAGTLDNEGQSRKIKKDRSKKRAGKKLSSGAEETCGEVDLNIVVDTDTVITMETPSQWDGMANNVEYATHIDRNNKDQTSRGNIRRHKSQSSHKQVDSPSMTEMSIIDEQLHRHKVIPKGSPPKDNYQESRDKLAPLSKQSHKRKDKSKRQRHGKRLTKEQVRQAQEEYEKVINETVSKTRRKRCCYIMTLLIVTSIVLGVVVLLAFYLTKPSSEGNAPTTAVPTQSPALAS